MDILLNGVLITIALFIGIGPQNLNIISHAIKKNHPYVVASTCFISDMILIIIGSFSIKLSQSLILIQIINGVGLLFILYYLILKIIKITKQYKKYKINDQIDTLKTSIIRALLLTWLNPLVIIDTVVIIGGLTSNYSNDNWYLFLIGAIIADIIWQYGITFIGITFSNKLNRPKIWWFLDLVTIVILINVLIKLVNFIYVSFK